jgi:carbon-monoxide dehydrogenase small subunit
MANKAVMTLTVNGEEHELLIPTHLTLLEVLREHLLLTGAKEGCGEGVCGSCTVLLDGRPTRSCLVLALEAQGAVITTIEGLADGETLDPVQEAFIDHGAIQCGFCTPGMILTAKAFLDEGGNADREAAARALSANICRCTGYTKIIDAVVAAGAEKGGDRE